MSAIEATPKDKVLVYIDPALSKNLRFIKAETRQPISEIVEDIIRAHFEAGAVVPQPPAREPRRAAAATA